MRRLSSTESACPGVIFWLQGATRGLRGLIRGLRGLMRGRGGAVRRVCSLRIGAFFWASFCASLLVYLQKKSTHASLVANTNLPATAAFLDRPCDDKDNNKKNAICCGSLLGAKKSSLPLGEGNAAFFWASFIIMRSAHASFVVNRICLPWRDFLAPSVGSKGLRGATRGSKGS